MSDLRYSPLAWKLFKVAFGPRMRRGIHRIHMTGVPHGLPSDKAVVIVPNHTSWWDGFLIRELQEAIRPRDAFYPVMLEAELAKRPFLRRLGGLGLTPGSSASFRRLLSNLKEARSTTAALTVLFFPQGRIWPSHRRPLGFQGGIRLLARALHPAIVLPVGLHLELGRWPAPSAFLSVSDPISTGAEIPAPSLLEERVQTELDGIHGFLAQHGEGVVEAWPPADGSLPLLPVSLEPVQ